MVVAVTLSMLGMVAVTAWSCYLVGFHAGGGRWLAEVDRIRGEAAAARRELYDLNTLGLAGLITLSDRRRRAVAAPHEANPDDSNGQV